MKKPTYADALEARIKEVVPRGLAEHTIEVKHMDEMYRHWRCQKPGTLVMHFDIVTWPGYLCYNGDMGEYLFCRTNDMIAFMRGSAMSYSYAAEKCVAHDGRLKEFREESFNEILDDLLEEIREEEREEFVTVMRHGRKIKESIPEKVQEIRRRYNEYSIPADAEKAMYESGIWDGCDLPSCKEYTYHFLWCLHAIAYFINKLDAESVQTSQV